MGPTWGRQDPGGPHVGPMNLAIWDGMLINVKDDSGDGLFPDGTKPLPAPMLTLIAFQYYHSSNCHEVKEIQCG